MRPLEYAKLEILKFQPKNRIFRVGDTFPGPGPLFHGCPHEAAGQHSSTGYVSLGKTSILIQGIQGDALRPLEYAKLEILKFKPNNRIFPGG